jgi:capsular exopolysaccharide synthesis family protein
MSDTPPEPNAEETGAHAAGAEDLAPGTEAPPGLQAAPAPPQAELMPWLDPRRERRMILFSGFLRRRRMLILAWVLPITAAAVVYVLLATPIYLAQARLVVQFPTDAQNGASAALNPLELPAAIGTLTRAAEITSSGIAGQAVDQLELATDPMFNSSVHRAATGGIVGTVLHAASTALDWISGIFGNAAEPPPGEGTSPAERAATLHDRLVNDFLASLQAVPEGAAPVIDVRFRSASPEIAMRAANVTARLYLAQQSDASTSAGTSSDSLSQRVQAASARLAAAQEKLTEFQQSAAAIPSGDTSAYEQQLARLEDDLTQARLVTAEANNRAQAAQKLGGQPDSAETSPALDSVPSIQQLRAQLARLTDTLATLRTMYKDIHPKIQDALEQIKETREKLRNEVAKAAIILASQADLAKTRERELTREIDRVQSIIQQQHEAAATKGQFEGEVRDARQAYDLAVAQLRNAETTPAPKATTTVRLISAATLPTVPVYPPKAIIVGSAFLFSLLIGVSIALAADLLEPGFRTRSQLELATGLGVLGLVPSTGAMPEGKAPHTRALDEPNSTYGEAIRALRATLFVIHGSAALRAVMITSSVPGEGKTTTAIAIATSAARAGKNTLIVECDVLRPSLHGALGCPRAPGLTEYLTGRATIDEVVRTDPVSGAHYITAGSPVASASELLASTALQQLIRALRETFELVVVDSPPVMAVSDTLVLQRLIDETVMVVHWQKTSREIVFASLRQIAESGGTIAGLVLTQVDMRKHAFYEYGARGKEAYGAYRTYHSDAS